MATNRLQSSTPQCVWSTWEWWWWWSLLLQQCHVIHQALMMVIRNQFGTTVESCQSIMFNVIQMQKEKRDREMIYDTRHTVWKIRKKEWSEQQRRSKLQPPKNIIRLAVKKICWICSSKLFIRLSGWDLTTDGFGRSREEPQQQQPVDPMWFVTFLD